jgi:serine/threonine protein kinase
MRNAFVEGVTLDGRFQTVSPLNHGSFGMVFLAKDMISGEQVAIKCLSKTPSQHHPSALPDESLVELACHDRLGHHPNVVNLIHSFETDAHVYLVLEFCSMGDLYEAIRLGQGPLETENVREFMLQLVNAVDFMHSKGLYHRDIKPENIFLTQDGSMKLGDFGLATTDAWSYEASVGSDRYMAPEQYDPGESGYAPAKADIWAIGICLLNVLFSRNPFVTPTESDILFADFARDNRSLFDIFPNMSQDTFDVLSHSMTLDPSKRSLDPMRDSLRRAVCFTTDDEVLDDFCTEDREVVPPSANREPLRTPSIQSPQVDQGGAFPWAKALHMSPQKPVRQLSVIPDNESFTEDLFPASEQDRTSWYSINGQNSSLASVLDSTLGASVKSMALRPPMLRNQQRSNPCSDSLSGLPQAPLPIDFAPLGKKQEHAAKSWTELWDEDEEDMMEHGEALNRRRQYNNNRSWSRESEDDDPTIHRSRFSQFKNSSAVYLRRPGPLDNASTTSLGAIHEHDSSGRRGIPIPKSAPRYSPPSKRTIMDKWAALGNRRRAFQHGNDTAVENGGKRANPGNWRSGLGLKVFSGNIGWPNARKEKDKGDSKVLDWRRDMHAQRPHQLPPPQQQQQPRDDQGDFEWVGGWHDLHL